MRGRVCRCVSVYVCERCVIGCVHVGLGFSCGAGSRGILSVLIL